MEALVFQYWNGVRPPYTYASEEAFRAYAAQIGADYYLSDGRVSFPCFHKRYFGALLPLFAKSFRDYDYVLYVDMDVIPVSGLTANVFEGARGDLMLVEEAEQPMLREEMKGRINGANDRKWARVIKRFWGVEVAADVEGRPKVFNPGVVVYSQAGMKRLRKVLPSVLLYQLVMKLARMPRFYCLDQNYLNAFLRSPKVDFAPLGPEWNSQVTQWADRRGTVHLNDSRTGETKFVHLQHGPKKNAMTVEEVRNVAHNGYDFSL
ncbi:MAG: hypothetical protein PHX82_08715 [Paracoccaceae bacterium]|nr:hypothetical protein [Paracoccaceae bacterium]